MCWLDTVTAVGVISVRLCEHDSHLHRYMDMCAQTHKQYNFWLALKLHSWLMNVIYVTAGNVLYDDNNVLYLEAQSDMLHVAVCLLY